MKLSLRPIVLVVTFILAGCGRNDGLITAPVMGKVTYRGKPLPNGTVMFVPGEGPAATGEISRDGSYRLSTGSLDGAVLGNHKVSITALAVPVSATTTKAGSATRPKAPSTCRAIAVRVGASARRRADVKG